MICVTVVGFALHWIVSDTPCCFCCVWWFCFLVTPLSQNRELPSLTLVLLKVSSCQREGKRWPSNQVREGSLSCWPRYALPQFFKNYTTNIIFAVSVEFSLGFFWCRVLLYWIWWRNLYETPLLYATFQNLYIHHSRSTSTVFIYTKVK